VTRDKRPSLALSETELERWKEAASEAGVTFSSLVREAVEVRLGPENGHALDLVGVVAAAPIIGVSKQRVSQLAAQGGMPPPLGRLDGRAPFWRREAIEAFARTRRREHTGALQGDALSAPTPLTVPNPGETPERPSAPVRESRELVL
jgi:hypothetical protein